MSQQVRSIRGVREHSHELQLTRDVQYFAQLFGSTALCSLRDDVMTGAIDHPAQLWSVWITNVWNDIDPVHPNMIPDPADRLSNLKERLGALGFDFKEADKLFASFYSNSKQWGSADAHREVVDVAARLNLCCEVVISEAEEEASRTSHELLQQL